MSSKLEPMVSQLGDETEATRQSWDEIDDVMSLVVRRVNELLPDQRAEMAQQLDSIVESLTLGGEVPLDEVRAQVAQLGRAARALRPLSRSVVTAMEVFGQLGASARAWRESLEP